jgi:hypothetical protein
MTDAFKFASDALRVGGAPSPAGRSAIRSPWSGTTLSKIVWSDVFGEDARTVSRAEAMRVPAIAKGRALICGTLARQPLAKFRGAELVPAEQWMYRTSTAQSPRQRMLWTLDDMLFNGMSLWATRRSEATGRILDVARVPPEWWEITPDLTVLVNGGEVTADEVIVLEGPQEGLLEIGADTIRAARAMDKAWRDRVEQPIPLTHLSSTDANVELTQDEVDDLVKNWEAARRAGGTAFTPYGVSVEFPGTTAADLYIAGRNALRLDFANFLALPGTLLDGSTATASLTYSTHEGARNELVDYSLSYWATPLEARLSQDDVVPAGTRTAFDLAYLSAPTQPAQGPASED